MLHWQKRVTGMHFYGIAVFLTASLSSVTALTFVHGPGSVIAPVGGTALLKCAVDLHTVRGSVTLYWYKAQNGGGFYITGGTQIYKQNQGWERHSLETSSVNGVYSYNLKIVGVEAGDSGEYQCTGIDGGGSGRSPRGSLSVVQEATGEPLSCSFYPESPTVGQTVTFSCTAPRGISTEMLSWWRDGTVRVQPSAQLSNNRDISFVKTLDNNDNFAEFTCLVGTSFDTASNMNCSVTPLAVPIRAEVTPETAIAVVGSSATFQCRGTAIPPVTRYRWIYGFGEHTIKISTSKRRFTIINNGDSSTLTIEDITLQDNDKIVRCVVLNEITKTIGSANLQVTTHIPTTQKTPIMLSSVSPKRTTIIARETPLEPRETHQPTTALGTTALESRQPHQLTTAQGTTGDIIGSTKGLTGTPIGSDDVIKLFGCGKDCGGEKISPQQDSDDGEGSGNGAVAAALSVLAICALATAVIVYIAYRKRGRTSGRVIKRKWKNKPLERLRSLRLSVTNSNCNQDLVNPDSVRLKTIEVIVNPPPPEWQLRVKDVACEVKEPQEQDLPKPDGDQSPVMAADCSPPAGEGDALYVKSDEIRKKKHHGKGHDGDYHHGDGDAHAHHIATATPPVPGQHLSADTDDCFNDGVSDASTWDMSSVDSGCEEETDELVQEDVSAYAELDLTKAGEGGTACTPQTETVEYANTTVTKTTLPRS